MISYKPKYRPVIKVYFKKFMDEIFKSNYNYSRKNRRRILESKGHYRILIASPFRDEGFFVAIFLRDSDLVIARETIGE